jgi:hypothetical protein
MQVESAATTVASHYGVRGFAGDATPGLRRLEKSVADGVARRYSMVAAFTV